MPPSRVCGNTATPLHQYNNFLLPLCPLLSCPRPDSYELGIPAPRCDTQIRLFTLFLITPHVVVYADYVDHLVRSCKLIVAASRNPLRLHHTSSLPTSKAALLLSWHPTTQQPPTVDDEPLDTNSEETNSKTAPLRASS
jgi:hypothetical protein